jgi:D-alanyl-D-alanine carboxypeptidase/D-alanyl-D-alanine-endopeptidase (penicillin-binding protein 4)
MKTVMPALLRSLALSLLLPFAQAGCAAHLPTEVEETLVRHKTDRDTISIWVQAVDGDQPVLAWNADLPQNPASVMKLVTTAAALDILGPQHTWPTEAYATAPIRRGVLVGDLVLKGYGNPMFRTEDLWMLLRKLRELGLQSIQGNLILDNTFFTPPAEDPAAFDGQPFKPYNALPDALLLNHRAIRFVFQPDPENGTIHVLSDPPTPGLQVINRIAPIRSNRCRRDRDEPEMRVQTTPDGTVVEFAGKLPLDCGTQELYRVVAEPKDMLLGAFRTLWEELGGRFEGEVRVGPTPAGATRLASVDSLPLADIIRPMNKWSSNVMTRQVVLTMGAKMFGRPGTTEKGRRAIRQWLETKGFHWPEFELVNGAGLSREGRITAHHLGELLVDVYHSPTMPEFMASLALVGIDGTARKRLKGEAIVGRAHVKTGTLSGVRAVAGYVLARSGRRYAIVVLHNEPGMNIEVSNKIQDEVIKWVYEQ